LNPADDALAALTPEQRAALELLLRRERASDPPPAPATAPSPILPRGDRTAFPLSFAQQRLWFLDQLTPGDPAYNIHGATRLQGALDVAALARSLRAIAGRHEVLRARFHTIEGRAEQVVAPAGSEPALPIVDLSALPAERREAEVLVQAVAEAQAPFDLARGPLLRTTLLRLAEAESVLLSTLHHIVADGGSIGILLRELPALYAGEELPGLRLQYADFAAWQRQRLAGDRLARELAHWRSRLAGLPELHLPAEPAGRPARATPLPVNVPASLAQRLREMGRTAGASLFMTLLAVFEVLLLRWSGQRDFAVGAPVANRNRPETEGLIGFFVNTLVLRAPLAGDPTFRGLLTRVRQAALDAFAHQDLPFEKLVEELQPERRLGHTPLFSAVLALQPPRPQAALPGITLSPLPVRNGTARFDLVLDLSEGAEGDGLTGTLEHAANVLSPLAARRMAGHLLALLEAAVADPARPLSELPLLTAAERHQVVMEWAGPEHLPLERSFGEQLAEQARRRPGAVAVVCEGAALSYGELDRRSNQLARRLRRIGAEPEAVVAISVDRSLEMVIGLLGILKAGAAYLPVDPRNPRERQSFMLEDCGAALLLTQERWAASFRRTRLRVLCLDTDWGTLAGEPETAPPSRGSPAHALAFLYTSGSTGRPKATLVEERGFLNLCCWFREVCAIDESTRALLGFAFSFDAAFKNIIVPLLAGGRLVLANPGPFDAVEVWSTIRDEQVTFLNTTPSQFYPVLGLAAADGYASLSSLRGLILGGEAAAWSELQPWLASGRMGSTLTNMYGPSECSDTVTSHLAAAEEVAAFALPSDRKAQRLPIGRPGFNMRLVIVDDDFQPLPVGIAGELCAAGICLARGYHDRPELTAERFLPDPIAAGGPGGRMYRTGDLARWLPDGKLELLGRLDDQVKVRGVRVEPAEVEAALAAHPAVRTAVVLAREGVGSTAEEIEERQVRLVAWVVPSNPAAAPSDGELRYFLRSRLPEAMVPAAFVILPALPLNPRGKLDRAALPEPDRGEPGAAAPEPPRDPAEELVASLWAAVLGRERVGIHDNFFHLGGHSLLATRLISRVRAAFGVELPVRRLFERPTVAGLAAAVREAKGLPTAPPLRAFGGSDPAPLSFAQRRLWIDYQLDPEAVAYNLPAGFRCHGALDFEGLRWGLGEILRRHEALRTSFPEIDGEPAARVAAPAPPALPLVDLSGLAEEAREAEAVRLAYREARRPFRLERGPLVRFHILRLAPADAILLLNVHHIISDGWSVPIFLRELSTLYAAFRRGGPSPLPALPVQYGDFARWQTEWLRGEELEARLAWWRERLGGPDELDLPVDRRPVGPVSPKAGKTPLRLGAERAAALRRAGLEAGATLYMTLLAALQALLGRYSGQETVRVGSPVAGRDRLEIEGLIGFFVNTLVLRIDLAGDPSFRELLGRVREAVLGAWAHQDLPFEKLVEELSAGRGAGRQPLFRVLFALQSQSPEELRLGDVEVSRLAIDPGTTAFDLAFALLESGEGVAGAIRYRADLFTAATMERLAGHLSVLLEAVAAEPGRRLSDLPILTGAERHQMLVEQTGPSRAYPPVASVHQLIEHQADRTPEATAVVSYGGDGEAGWMLTYQELERRANQLAHHLRHLGVGPEVPVGICMDRSAEMVVALLGVLKAGGAYLPIDPRNPGERRSFLLEDCAAAVLLTQERWAAELRRPGLRVLPLDSGWEAVGRAPAERPAVLTVPANAVALLYTSGSTGLPKATLETGRGFLNLCLWFRDYFPVTADVRSLLTVAFSFDAAFKNIVVPLMTGGRVVLANPGAFDPAELWAAIRDERVTFINGVSSVLYPILHLAAGDGFASLASLEHVSTGGESTLWAELRPWVASGSCHSAVYHAYGPSECSDLVSLYRAAPAEIATEDRLPIGRPADNLRVHVLDAGSQEQPVGVPGELCVAGDGLARGYFGRPDLTARRFVPDPFGHGERMYRTGDLARRRPDGNLEILGRIDYQIKVRGVRIEPKEVETALLAHPGVQSAVVVAVADPPGNARLAACVVPSGGSLSAGELRSFLRDRLPDALVPSSFAFIPAIPLTPRGKVDREAVRSLAAQAEPARAGSRAPRDEMEERMAALWAEVLGLASLGIHDDFFELGGHSLLATRLIARVRTDFAVELPARRLFERPTVAGLAEAVRAASPGSLPALPPRRRESGGPAPLSFAQQRLWVLHQISPGLVAYNMPAGLRLHGRLDGPALLGTLSEIVRRHEALRTRFEIRDGQPVQVVEPAVPLPVLWIDLAALPAAARAVEEQKLARLEAALPFDLGRPPLLRAWIVRSAQEEHLLLLTLQHIASDAWSMGVAVGELTALYSALAAGLPSPLPELPLQYADFAVEQRAAFQGDALARETAFWRERLAGARPLDLLTDRPRRPVPSFSGAAVSRLLPAGATAGLQRMAREARATPFMVLLVPFLALLARITGTEDVVVGTTVTGRDRPGLNDLIGFFVNTLVLRADLRGDPDGRGLLGRVRQTVLEAFSHQALPFERLVDDLGLPRDPYRPLLLRVLVQHLARPEPPLELPGLTLEGVERRHDTAKFDLVLNLQPTPEGFLAHWIYDSDLFERPTVLRFAEMFSALCQTWMQRPDLRLAEVPLLTAAERHQSVVEWNPAPAHPSAAPRCLHRRFEEQVERAPQAVAVVFEGAALNYRDLDARANRLAHRLIALGVRVGDRVALCMERSLEMVVALLGVLKAGAAYVPLDPADPAERIDHILADSGAQILLAVAGALPDLAAPRARLVPLEADGGQMESGLYERPSLGRSAPELPAYVIYTSGSTGKPKGVVVSHAHVDRLLTATEPWFGFGPQDIWTLFHSYAFDFSVWEIWGALAYGGRLVIVPFWVSRSPQDFLRLLMRERVTVLNQTPSAFRQLLWAEEAALDGAGELSLRCIVFGGEALEPASLRPWIERHGLERPALINMYGITETTVHVTGHRLTAADLEHGSRIGRPIPDLSLHVLDRRLEPQPIGVPGEICVGGAGLAQGYLGRPGLTAERFVPDPFSTLPGERLYRSGDLARRLPDGDVEYLGRIDHQVKVRGFRVELGEIEAALAAHPGVREAVVLAREDGPGRERRLVAYLVPGPAGEPGLAGWREHLAARLPDSMMPSAAVVLPALPLTVNGKIDRRALPAPAEAAVPQPSSPPRTALERYLAGLFRQVLGDDREIGVDDDFFALGGSSITGAILINRLQETLGEIVHVVVIFDRPTVASLAAYVTGQHPQAAQRLWGEGDGAEEDGSGGAVGPAEIAAMRALIDANFEASSSLPRALPWAQPERPLGPENAGGVLRRTGEAVDEPRNPPALFVLSPPRSGSTLLRVMLGAHPALFAPPELELLTFRTMADRRSVFQGRDSFWLEGVIRAVMEARGCTAEEAERIVAETEQAGWTTRRFYRTLQEWIGGRMLVDKTPSYALDPRVLQRAEAGFAGARYLHLLRHPQATNRSFAEAKLDQIFFRRPHTFSRRQLAELVWTVSHRNILDFLAAVPDERKLTVRFEDLVRDPRQVLAGICAFLGIEVHPDMVEPYRPGAARMVDGPHAVSRMLGDVKLLDHGKVDAAVADRWREAAEPALGEPARHLAGLLGYDLPGRAAPERGALVRLSAPLPPGEPERRPLFCVHPVGGEVTAYIELAHRLPPGQPFYALQAPERTGGPLTDLRQMAALYLESVRQVQPAGPYRLAGWSLGGVLAYEMACQSALRGESVELLALIDVAAPDRLSKAGGGDLEDAGLALQFARDQAGLLGIHIPEIDLSGLHGLGIEEVLTRILEIGHAAGALAPAIELRDIRRLFEHFRANRRALAGYQPAPYPGPAVLFRSGDRVARLKPGEDPSLGWGDWITGGLQILDLPGDHYSILRGTIVQELAARLAG
jgi:amino acid adenylation domain-containing protein